MMVLRMNLEMTRQVIDLFAQDGNLNLGRTRVGGVSLIGSYNLILMFPSERQMILLRILKAKSKNSTQAGVLQAWCQAGVYDTDVVLLVRTHKIELDLTVSVAVR
jgi:hypothetical protein